jgi:C_GCAxxG_C_C family probable redox protein
MKKDRRDVIKIMATCALCASFGPLYVHGGEKGPHHSTKKGPQKNRVEEALSNMQKYGSCCTGILATYSPGMGIDKDTAAGLGRGMAGGIGGLGNVCGAVSGAALVIGLKTTHENNISDGAAGMKTMEIVREFVSRFEERHASIICRELIGHDISTTEKSQAAMKANAFNNCPKFIESAVIILDQMFPSDTT